MISKSRSITPVPRYVAFLRAINVGGHTVKMDNLRRLFEAMGFTNVEPFIASGNVIFDSTSKSTAALEKKIEAHMQGESRFSGALLEKTLRMKATLRNSTTVRKLASKYS